MLVSGASDDCPISRVRLPPHLGHTCFLAIISRMTGTTSVPVVSGQILPSSLGLQFCVFSDGARRYEKREPSALRSKQSASDSGCGVAGVILIAETALSVARRV